MFRRSFLQEGCRLVEEDVLLLIECRQEYAYPAAHMRLSFEPTPFQLSKDHWAAPVHGGQQITDFEHDTYHQELLTSEDPLKVLLGSCSTVYWGFITHGEGYSLNRVYWHRYGRQLPPTEPGRMVEAMQAALSAADSGKAIGCFSRISQLGGLSFASKIWPKAAPMLAGTMDRQIDKGLRSSQWASSAPFIGLGRVSSHRTQNSYQAWCEFLQNIAEQLNAGIAVGAPWCWRKLDRSLMQWRPVDVERAIFAYYKRNANRQSCRGRCPTLIAGTVSYC